MHYVPCRCDLSSGLYKQLGVILYCLLEDGYSVVTHFFVVVCEYLSLIIQHSLAVLVEAERFKEAADIFFILSVVVVRTATFAARSGRLIRHWGAVLHRIGRLFWGHTGIVSSGSWWGCTNLCLSGSWWACTGLFLERHWRDGWMNPGAERSVCRHTVQLPNWR